MDLSSLTNAATKGETRRVLYALDFDHTILQGNSDYEVVSLAKEPLPQEIKDFYKEAIFTHYMNKVFAFLHSKGVCINEIKTFIKGMEPTPGMVTLLKEIHKRPKTEKELLIISDANDVFINAFLSSIDVEADAIITNSSSITPQGQLVLEPFEDQESCSICPRNLCKGAALDNFLKSAEERGSPFSSVVYVGDGHNDLCPALRLSTKDLLFVRKGFSLEKILNGKMKVKGRQEVEIFKIKAKTTFWDNADVILPPN